MLPPNTSRARRRPLPPKAEKPPSRKAFVFDRAGNVSYDGGRNISAPFKLTWEVCLLLPVIATLALTWGLCMPLYFGLKNRGWQVPSLVFKALPTAMAAAFAGWAALSLHAGRYAWLIFAGLCVCVAADVLLNIRFEVGGGFFFCGHVLYVLALSQYRVLNWWCLALFLLSAVALQFFLRHYQAKVPTPFILLGLRLYALALAALLALGLPLPFLAFSPPTVMAALGAVLFVLSDLTLCHNTLLQKPTGWHFVSLGVYYAGQLLLGLSAIPIS